MRAEVDFADVPKTSQPLLISCVRALRPRQWTKNLVVFAPLLFSKNLLFAEAALHAVAAWLSFCLLASAVYVMNDWADRDNDRLHPSKRNRPIAAGLINAPTALALGLVCLGLGLATGWYVGLAFAEIAASYVVLQILYTIALKQIALLDVMVIALGFVIRVAGGAAAISVPVSHWLYLCTLLGALFLGFAKRRHELTAVADGPEAHRAALSAYSVSLLDQLISVVAAACIVAYSLYTVAAETLHKVGSDRMKFTVPFVLYGIFRYLYLIHRSNAGGSPENVLLFDRPILWSILLFLGTAGWALYS